MLLKTGCDSNFVINVLLTILGWLPGVIRRFFSCFSFIFLVFFFLGGEDGGLLARQVAFALIAYLLAYMPVWVWRGVLLDRLSCAASQCGAYLFASRSTSGSRKRQSQSAA